MADFIIAFIELLEAEGRLLRQSVFSLGWTLMLVVCAGIFLAVGGSLMLAGFYRYLLSTHGLVFALTITGLFSVTLALLLIWTAKRLNQ